MSNNNKGSGIFLGVIGVATLIVAIIGATFAFFGASISSPEGAVTVGSAVLKLGYADDQTGLKTALIPAKEYIATYAATNQKWINKEQIDQDTVGMGECIDQNGNQVCGTYTFTIGNPSFTTQQDIYGSIKVATNDFTDLYFKIFDEQGKEVVPMTAFSPASTEGTIELSQLNQTLLPSSKDTAENGTFKEEDPKTYTVINDKSNSENDGLNSNVRTYKMVIWIEETDKDQTETNSGKTMAASINFTTASGASGTTGVIAAAQKPEDAE